MTSEMFFSMEWRAVHPSGKKEGGRNLAARDADAFAPINHDSAAPALLQINAELYNRGQPDMMDGT